MSPATTTEAPAAGTPTSAAAAPAPTKTPTGGNSSSTAIEFEPPLACVRRILKHALPSSTNVGKDASAAFARACGIFVIYITACANDFARENKRQTITANDVLAAVKVRLSEELAAIQMSLSY
jgi:histone H3/H4